MTLQALRLPKKVEPSPDNREQEVTMTVYGGTGKLPWTTVIPKSSF